MTKRPKRETDWAVVVPFLVIGGLGAFGLWVANLDGDPFSDPDHVRWTDAARWDK